MTLLICCALKAEARPLIDALRLKLNTASKAFPLWESEQIQLVISGTGKTNAASAVAYCSAFSQLRPILGYLNIGIAGHQDFPLGAGFLAHKITEQSSEKNWYPALAFSTTIPSFPVLTIDRVQNSYSPAHLYEMEAAGFFSAAARFATAELIHCYKIVSDNQDTPFDQINEKSVARFMHDHLKPLESVCQSLFDLMRKLPQNLPPQLVSAFLEKSPFSATQECQLRRLLHRCLALQINTEQLLDMPMKAGGAKRLLNLLEQALSSP